LDEKFSAEGPSATHLAATQFILCLLEDQVGQNQHKRYETTDVSTMCTPSEQQHQATRQHDSHGLVVKDSGRDIGWEFTISRRFTNWRNLRSTAGVNCPCGQEMGLARARSNRGGQRIEPKPLTKGCRIVPLNGLIPCSMAAVHFMDQSHASIHSRRKDALQADPSLPAPLLCLEPMSAQSHNCWCHFDRSIRFRSVRSH
jgi:hypothetical protein